MLSGSLDLQNLRLLLGLFELGFVDFLFCCGHFLVHLSLSFFLLFGVLVDKGNLHFERGNFFNLLHVEQFLLPEVVLDVLVLGSEKVELGVGGVLI